MHVGFSYLEKLSDILKLIANFSFKFNFQICRDRIQSLSVYLATVFSGYNASYNDNWTVIRHARMSLSWFIYAWLRMKFSWNFTVKKINLPLPAEKLSELCRKRSFLAKPA